MEQTLADERRALDAVEKSNGTRDVLLDAARICLREHGYAALSTRLVAETAGMPLSQIHYHFGSKQGLVLALYEQLNARLLARQEDMYAEDEPLWRKWEHACDFLDEDLDSGYVRVLQELSAAGWSEPEIAEAVRRNMRGWYELIAAAASRAAERFGGLGPLQPDEIASLIGGAFIGAEANILLGFEEDGMPIRKALRRVGDLIRSMEEDQDRGG